MASRWMNARSKASAVGGEPSAGASPTGTTLRALALAFLIMFSSLLAGVSLGRMGGGIMLLPAILLVGPIASYSRGSGHGFGALPIGSVDR
jgi:hypothetical protein